MKKILLVGAGQLGSRYLQGLSALRDLSQITVVDPSENSLSIAKERFACMPVVSDHVVTFSSSIENAPNAIDLALIVTPAHCRARVVSELVSRHRVKAWVLEKILAQNCDQLDQIQRDLVAHKQVWVNTPRRLMAWHQEIRAQLLNCCKAPLKVRVVGSCWGLACNAIHFIDLVSWWVQASVESIDSTGLSKWTQSKRPGFFEVFGCINVSYIDGTELQLCCDSGSDAVLVNVTTPEGEWIIDEVNGVVTQPSGCQSQGQLVFQSSLTASLVEQIFRLEDCQLPTLSESVMQHRFLLTALLEHWNLNQSSQDSIVPIT